MSLRRDFPDLPPVWAVAGLAAQFALDRYVPILRLDGDWAFAAGWITIAAGLILIGWSVLWFRRKATTIEPRGVPTALIAEGPYRLNRNPIYSGMAMVLFGTGLLSGSVSAILVAPVFVAIIDRRFVRGEEAALRSAFGPAAEDYIATTRRW